MNDIGLKSVSDLLGKNFFIPSYQRGYRWDKQRVVDLLSDIYSFTVNDKKANEYYCLQPIIVKELDDDEIKNNNLSSSLDNNKWYEVIDGQQRLTTIRILFTYLIQDGLKLKDKYDKDEFILRYETREETKTFLENINVKSSNKNKSIDHYYIYQAYNHICEWFDKEKNIKGKKIDFLTSALTLDMENKDPTRGVVQVIWYEIKDKDKKVNPIEIFTRINMGKIPLTSAELIKALFLQESVLKEENYKDNQDYQDELNLRKLKIAGDWDRIEYALQKDDFWLFLNKDLCDKPARIEFLFNLIFELARKDSNSKEDFDKLYGTDEYKLFRFYYDKFSEDKNKDKTIDYNFVKKEWEEIENHFLAFEDWYNDPVWFHYIGFLIYCGDKIIDIYKDYNGFSKDKFTGDLESKISDKFNKIICKKVTNNGITNYNIPVFYKKNDKNIRQLLLLFNIEYIVEQYRKLMEEGKKTDIFHYKFPFNLFKYEEWDIEHIASYTENELNDTKSQKEWLKYNLKGIRDLINKNNKEELKELEDIEKDIDLFNNEKEEEKQKDIFYRIYEKTLIKENIDNKILDEETKNSIGNLTLLNASINRGYGNDLFPTKRREIIEKDNDGKFIPICTKYVFLKYFNENSVFHTKWGEEDIRSYQNKIGEKLDRFLTFEENKNE